jgi:hypothetical protein
MLSSKGHGRKGLLGPGPEENIGFGKMKEKQRNF